MGTVSSRGCHCIQDLSSSIQIIIAMEDLLKQQFQKGSPPTVLPIGVACDATCSIEVNLIICLWCAHPLAVCSAETELLPAMKQMKSRQQEQLVPTVGTAI